MRKGNLRKKLVFLLIVAIVAATPEMGHAQDSQQDRQSLNSAPLPVRFQTPAQAVADLDGDRLPDRAELASTGSYKNIQLTLSSLRGTNLSFSTESPQPGSLLAEDIDHDSDNDLIWVSDEQSTGHALWLNNGIGEFTRVEDTSAYNTDIKRLIADESQGGFLASSSNKQLLATGTIGYQLLARSGRNLPVAPHSTSPKCPRHSCATALSPCVSRYPKRGPPSFLS